MSNSQQDVGTTAQELLADYRQQQDEKHEEDKPQKLDEQGVPEFELTDEEKELDTLVASRKEAKKRERGQSAKTAPETSAEDDAGDEVTALLDADEGELLQASPGETDEVTPGQEGGEQATEGTQDAPTPFSYTYNEQVYDEATVQEAIQWKSWADSLNDQAKLAINALLSGSHYLVDKAQYESFQTSQTQTSPQTSPTAPASVLTEDELADLDPGVRKMFDQQQAALAEQQKRFDEQQQFIQQQQQATMQQQVQNAITTATTNIKTKYQLSDSEFSDLDKFAGQVIRYENNQPVSLVTHFVKLYGDPSRALNEAYEIAYRQNFEQREIQRQLAAQTQAQQVVTQQQSKVDTRKRNAAKLNPAGASVPATATKPASRRTNSDQWRANLTNDLDEILSQS